MKSLLKLSIPAIVLALCFTHSAIAQVDGYRFGRWLDYAGGHNRYDRNFFGPPIAPTPRIDQPPFFALICRVLQPRYSERAGMALVDMLPRPVSIQSKWAE